MAQKTEKTAKSPATKPPTKPPNPKFRPDASAIWTRPSPPSPRLTATAASCAWATLGAGSGSSVIPTGALAVDLALGVGGVPRGRVVEIFGPESSGKTTLMLHVIANAQKAGGLAAFIDAEHALDPAYAKRLGVNLDDLLVSQPDSGEEALEYLRNAGPLQRAGCHCD